SRTTYDAARATTRIRQTRDVVFPGSDVQFECRVFDEVNVAVIAGIARDAGALRHGDREDVGDRHAFVSRDGLTPEPMASRSFPVVRWVSPFPISTKSPPGTTTSR